MKISGSNKDRELHAHRSDDDFLLIERVRYSPAGHSHRKWDEDRIIITREELRKLIANQDVLK